MGAWGTAISSNDTYADIYGDFFDLYNDGFEVAEISKKLIADNQEIITDADNSDNLGLRWQKHNGNVNSLTKTLSTE